MKTEIKVGVFVFISFLVILFSIAYLGRSSFRSEGKEYNLVFTFLNDLKEGADVKFAGGILIGYVKKITPVKEKVKVKIWVKKDFPVTTNAKFSIMTSGLIGEKYINISYIEQFEGKVATIKEGSKITGFDSVSFGELMQNMYQLGRKLGEMIDNVNFILGGISKRKDVQRISRHVVKLLKETTSIVEGNKENVKNLISQVMDGVKSVNIMLTKELPNVLRSTNQSVFAITRDITSLTRDIKNILYEVKSGQGVIGKMIMDRKLAKSVEEIIVNLKKVSEKLLSNPIFSERKGREGKYNWGRR